MKIFCASVINRAILLLLLTGVFCTAAIAAEDLNQLAQNEQTVPEKVSPAPGTLVIPGELPDQNTAGKKCMTVCALWGEECSYVNRGPAGTTRSCRRTCQQYTEECF
jgi:hypothetical protein